MFQHPTQDQGRTASNARLLFLALLLACSASCSSWNRKAERDVVKHGITFESFHESANGSKLGTLSADSLIEGWPCRKDFVVFHPDWRLDELQLSRDYERNGIFMPEGTWAFPDERGNPGVCMFPRDVVIQGHSCRGSKMGKEGIMTRFYPSGKLKYFYSRDPVTIDGVPCRDGLIQGIGLHENGRLQQCKLDSRATIGSRSYPKGAVIRFDDVGNVISDGSK